MASPETPAPDGVTVQATVPYSAILEHLLETGQMHAAVSYAAYRNQGGEAASEAALDILALLREKPWDAATAEASLEAALLWVKDRRAREPKFDTWGGDLSTLARY